MVLVLVLELDSSFCLNLCGGACHHYIVHDSAKLHHKGGAPDDVGQEIADGSEGGRGGPEGGRAASAKTADVVEEFDDEIPF